jgi:hypothetical protein
MWTGLECKGNWAPWLSLARFPDVPRHERGWMLTCAVQAVGILPNVVVHG